MSIALESKPITEYYDNFILIDRDTQGGLARVAQVSSRQEPGTPMRAFKVMRNDESSEKLPFEAFFKKYFKKRFVKEFEILKKLTGGQTMFTRLHDSGFVQEDIVRRLEKRDDSVNDLRAYKTGLDLDLFQQIGQDLASNEAGLWRPYLVIDLAPYENSLFRIVRRRHGYSLPRQSGMQFEFIARFGMGDILEATVQLLDGIADFHKKTGYLYWDYKPEHIYLGPKYTQTENFSFQLDLVDYNVPRHILKNEDDDGNLTTDKDKTTIRQEMKIEIANICGSVLYPALVMQTLEGENLKAKPGIGPNPSDKASDRYFQSGFIPFHEAEQYLDEDIKNILRKALKGEGFTSIQGFKEALLDYAKKHLGLDLENPANNTKVGVEYRIGLRDLRRALIYLQKARQHFKQGYDLADEDAINTNEFFYLLQAVDHTLEHYVLP